MLFTAEYWDPAAPGDGGGLAGAIATHSLETP